MVADAISPVLPPYSMLVCWGDVFQWNGRKQMWPRYQRLEIGEWSITIAQYNCKVVWIIVHHQLYGYLENKILRAGSCCFSECSLHGNKCPTRSATSNLINELAWSKATGGQRGYCVSFQIGCISWCSADSLSWLRLFVSSSCFLPPPSECVHECWHCLWRDISCQCMCLQLPANKGESTTFDIWTDHYSLSPLFYKLVSRHQQYIHTQTTLTHKTFTRTYHLPHIPATHVLTLPHLSM